MYNIIRKVLKRRREGNILLYTRIYKKGDGQLRYEKKLIRRGALSKGRERAPYVRARL